MALAAGTRGEGAYANSIWQTGGQTADGQQAVGGWVPHDWGNIGNGALTMPRDPGCGDFGIVNDPNAMSKCLPPDKAPASDGGSTQSGGASGAPGSGSTPRGSLGALEAMGGMRPGGADWSTLANAGHTGAMGDVSGLAGGGAVMASDAPVDPNTASQMPPDIATGQTLVGPGADRQGLGRHIPPSIAALLKPKVY